MPEIRAPLTPATLDNQAPPAPVTISAPIIPSEAELKKRTQALQKQMGIPTEDEIDPLGPGGTDQELWPAQPGEQWIDFRIA